MTPGKNFVVSTLAALLVAASPVVAPAAAPEIEAGECLYLVGAPAGEPQAGAEQRASNAGIHSCDAGVEVDAAANRVRDNSVEVNISNLTGGVLHCDAFAWTGHEFRFSETSRPATAHVRIEGYLRAALGIPSEAGLGDQVVLAMELLEVGPDGEQIVLDRRMIVDRDQRTAVEFDDTIGAQLTAALRPGRAYRARLYLEAILDDQHNAIIDFGNNGIVTEERGAWYDSIQVCIDEPLDLSEIEDRLDQIETKQDESLANQDAMQVDLGDIQTTVEGNSVKLDEALTDHDGLEANQDAIRTELGVVRGVVDGNSAKLDELLARQAREHLEWQLYQKDCLPALWLPATEGGKIELARDLVADRLASAEATGAKGANTKVARERLEAADALIAAADYQTACRRLSEALRALTTP